jgi:hypothetical protein
MFSNVRKEPRQRPWAEPNIVAEIIAKVFAESIIIV